MGDLKAPSVLSELLTLWKLATASERTEFLARITSPARPMPPLDSGPPPLVKLDSEPGR